MLILTFSSCLTVCCMTNAFCKSIAAPFFKKVNYLSQKITANNYKLLLFNKDFDNFL